MTRVLIGVTEGGTIEHPVSDQPGVLAVARPLDALVPGAVWWRIEYRTEGR